MHGDDLSSSYDSMSLLPRMLDAGAELDSLCRAEIGKIARDNIQPAVLGFPPSCLAVIRLIAGNSRCVDCGYDQSDGLIYASLGYGTILCQDCVHRHKTLSEQDSNIKHLINEYWDLRSTLTMFEGGNRKLLEFVKQKSAQQHPKNGRNEKYSRDVICFNNVYHSEAACAYRNDLAQKVDATLLVHKTAKIQEDTARKEKMILSYSTQNIFFQQLMNQNDSMSDNRQSRSFEENRRRNNFNTSGTTTRPEDYAGVSPIDIVRQKIDRRRRTVMSSSGSGV